MEKAFNMGVGMAMVIAPDEVDRAMAILTARHVEGYLLGTVEASGHGEPRVVLTGEHPRW